jgi:AcrR family transcriptional regulator
MARVSAVQRRRDLTDAAVTLILEEGPRALSARRIADRAGAPLGAVHYAFRDLDELIHRANVEVLDRLARAVVQGVRTDQGLKVFIEDFLHGFWRYLRNNDTEALAFFETFIALMRSHTAAGAVDTAERRLVTLMTEAQRHDTRPSRTPLPQLAVLLTMAVDGLSLIHLARRDEARTIEELTHLIDAYQHLV